ncbi:hypothetical protein AgCh_001501 [Apium graveolens]
MTDAIYLVRCLVEKYQKRRDDLHMVFIDFEKAYDNVSHAVIWRCLKAKGVMSVSIRRPRKSEIPGSSTTSTNEINTGQDANTVLLNNVTPTPWKSQNTIPLTPNNPTLFPNRDRTPMTTTNTNLQIEQSKPQRGRPRQVPNDLLQDKENNIVGRPRRTPLTPITAPRPLLARMPNDAAYLQTNHSWQMSATFQQPFGRGQVGNSTLGHPSFGISSTEQAAQNKNVGSASSSHSTTPIVNLLSSFDEVVDIESDNDAQGDVIGSNNDDVPVDDLELITPRRVDKFVNVHGGGPFCYRQGGQNHHNMGSFKPIEGSKPQFCQLYFYDTDNEVDNRIFAIQSKNKNSKDGTRPEIVQNLIKMFDEVSPLAKKFRQARDCSREEEIPELKILLKESRSASRRPNHITPSSEVAVLLVGENDPNIGDRDVILRLKHGGLERISFIHPLFMALQYPILFPFAEDGFHKDIKYIRTTSNSAKKRENVTLKDYYSYRLHIRPHEALHVIEFQKRGLPHAHMVIWLHPDSKPKTVQQVDQMVSAEIPDKQQDPLGYDVVSKFMIHGPCGELNKLSPCMDSDHKTCTRHFPKRYSPATSFDDSGFPVYRRHKTNHTVNKNNMDLDNRWVVPYNIELLVMFQCHINVEICNHSRSIKYLFKYCMKGHDRATMLLVKSKQSTTTVVPESNNIHVKTSPIGEISQYLDGRYVCAGEAVWRIYGFNIHHRTPSVERLPVHLEDMQTITFRGNESLIDVANRASFRLIKLQAWFEANKKYPWARNLTYQEFPSSFVWDARGCQWTPRKQGLVVGRLNSTYATSGDSFYLRMILTRFKGATSFTDLRTINSQLYSTYKDTCNALGLLQNDMEWHEAIKENSHHATSSQLCQLFVHILVNCEVNNPLKLWNDHINDFTDDILWMRRRVLNNNDLLLPEDEIKFWALAGKSLRNYPDMPFPPDQYLCGISNTLIAEERSYDLHAMIAEHEKLHTNLNADQIVIYDEMIESERKIVLPVASSGIAAVLLPGGRTAHSRFKIPLDVDEQSSCGIEMGTDIAELLQNTDLIIWDEAPMLKRYAFEVVDGTLRDIMGCVSSANRLKPFGGITTVFGGDFRQILPVCEKGDRKDIVSVCINRSYLWDTITVLTLKQNIRLHRGNSDELNNAIDAFSKWVLNIGDGRNSFVSEDDPNRDPEILIPDQFIIPRINNPLTNIINVMYPGIELSYKEHQYLKDRAILSPTNKIVDEINNHVLDRIPGEEHVYLSVDIIDEGPINENDQNSAFPEEFLNSIDMPGMPKHKLKLKIGGVVMLTRNINQVFGMCNGTRLIAKKLFKWTVECEIITGSHAETRHIILRFITTPPNNNSKWPFIFKRKQFPLQALLEVLAALEENIAPTCCVWDAHNISTRIKQLGVYVNSSNKSSTSTSTSVAGKYQHFRTFGREMQRGLREEKRM